MSTRYNVGIVGYSWAATAHIDAIAATSKGRVTDVMSSRPLDAEELSRRHGTPIRMHTDLDAMLADPSIDVVDIAGYPGQHAGQVHPRRQTRQAHHHREATCDRVAGCRRDAASRRWQQG